MLLGHFVSDDLADGLDRHYLHEAAGNYEAAFMAEQTVEEVLGAMAPARRRAQMIGAFALVPFVVHADRARRQPRRAAVSGVVRRISGGAARASGRSRRCARLALREARHEYAEYYFLFPLFLSITLLTSAGFFDALQGAHPFRASTRSAMSHVAFAQFLGIHGSCRPSSTTTSWPTSRHAACTASTSTCCTCFAMAQIAGYALGGCWTHIGCAQSVVAFAFIQRDVDAHYTPIQWIKEMTPVIIQILVLMAVFIYAEGALLNAL